jgi:hypothetical protein
VGSRRHGLRPDRVGGRRLWRGRAPRPSQHLPQSLARQMGFPSLGRGKPHPGTRPPPSGRPRSSSRLQPV